MRTKYVMVGGSDGWLMNHDGEFSQHEYGTPTANEFLFDSKEEAIATYENRWRDDYEFVPFDKNDPQSPALGIVEI